MNKRTILYNDESLNIVSNDMKIIQYLEEEFEGIYTFTTEENVTINKKIIILNNTKFYDTYKNKIDRTVINEKIIIIKERRKVIIVYDKIKENIIIIFKGISSTVIQYIGEMILSVFGKELEHKGVKFIHASAVSKDNQGIAILGRRNSGKTTIMCELLQEEFEFVSNSHVRDMFKKRFCIYVWVSFKNWNKKKDD